MAESDCKLCPSHGQSDVKNQTCAHTLASRFAVEAEDEWFVFIHNLEKACFGTV